jgi:hypothetical protein
VPADAVWVSLAQKAAEHGAGVFGLPSAKALRLTMGVEELLLYLAQAIPGQDVRITISGRSTHVAAEFEFASEGMDLSALNITSGAAHDEDDIFVSMPLLLASRMTDGFSVERMGERTRIALRVDRVYQEVEPGPGVRREVRGAVSVIPAPEAAVMVDACARVCGLYPVHLVPVWFRTPGKVVDMVDSGEMGFLVAVDESGATCGMICWETPSKESVAFYGPYTFTESPDVSRLLVEELVRTVGRTSVKVVFSHIATEDLSGHGFEPLARVTYYAATGEAPSVLPIWYRHLREDFGASVWAHPDLVPFLEERYDELVLMRDIRPTSGMGERVNDASVFSTKLTRELNEAVLRPMLNGVDNAENLERHLAALRKEGYQNIFFQVDLSSGWQAALGGDLLAMGFTPAMLLPHGGQSDVVMFQYVEPAA